MIGLRSKTNLALGFCLLALWGCAPPSTESAPSDIAETSTQMGTIVLGDISNEPVRKIKEYQPFADYLASQLNDVGIGQGAVEIAPDPETMGQLLVSGEVDLYFDSPYPAMIANDNFEARPILRRWKNGVESYHTVIFTRADSGISSVADLNGKMIAFDDPVSTSGYMLPLAHLKMEGLTVTEKSSVTEAVAADEVGYVFSNDEDNSIQWALTQRVAATAIGSADFAKIPEETRQQLKILVETEEVPRHMVIVSPTLSEEEVSAITAALLAMGETEAEKAVLEQFEATTKFDEFPEGADAALKRMREMYQLTQE